MLISTEVCLTIGQLVPSEVKVCSFIRHVCNMPVSNVDMECAFVPSSGIACESHCQTNTTAQCHVVIVILSLTI